MRKTEYLRYRRFIRLSKEFLQLIVMVVSIIVILRGF